MLERDLARDLAAGDYRRRRWERHAVERERASSMEYSSSTLWKDEVVKASAGKSAFGTYKGRRL